MNNRTIHWLGAGLSSGPGILKLAESGRRLILWNRTLQRAQDVFLGRVKPPTTSTRELNAGALEHSVDPGDIVVSMLPATMHIAIADICQARQAHLVTTSYISDGMRERDSAAQKSGLCFVNECGLDPGIDHVFAHLLINAWRESPAFDPAAELDFKSYCGGIPKEPNDFKYKFSWSPAGVLRALTNRARFVEAGKEAIVERAWESVKILRICGEDFEVYPNRDSIPYVDEYGFEKSWNVQQFVRGTIRLAGWSRAWSTIFAEIPGATNERIEALGAELWDKYAYAKHEQDRVVLFVSLQAQKGGSVLFEKYFFIDDSGTGIETSMARLVSWPATYAVDALADGRVRAGVSGAPHDLSEMNRWITNLRSAGVQILESS